MSSIIWSLPSWPSLSRRLARQDAWQLTVGGKAKLLEFIITPGSCCRRRIKLLTLWKRTFSSGLQKTLLLLRRMRRKERARWAFPVTWLFKREREREKKYHSPKKWERERESYERQFSFPFLLFPFALTVNHI